MLALPLVGRQDYRGAHEGHRCRVPSLGTQLCFPSKAVSRTCFEAYTNSKSVL